jgi:hypothetical protein
MPTEVAFSTSRTIQSQTDLGHVATDLYQRIRVLADCRFDSDSTVEITLVLVEAGRAPGHLDRYLLDPDESVQRTYQVPARNSGSPHAQLSPDRAASTCGSGATRLPASEWSTLKPCQRSPPSTVVGRPQEQPVKRRGWSLLGQKTQNYFPMFD